MKTDDNPETRTYKLTIFKCSQCGQRGIPLEGRGTDCIACDGEFDTETPSSQVHELTPDQAADIDDSVITVV